MSNLLDEYRRIISIKNNNINNKTSNRLSYLFTDTKSNIFKDKDGDIKMALITKNQRSINKNNKKQKTQIICSHCQKTGHLESNCFILYPHLKSKKSINSTISYKDNNNNKVILSTNRLSSQIANLNQNIEFILDSGATIHTCYQKELFINMTPSNTYIKWGNTNRNLLASGEGTIIVKFENSNKIIKLTKVLYVPELGVNLLSLSLITTKGFNISFNKTNCFIFDINQEVIASGSYRDGITIFNASNTKSNKS